MHVTETKLQKLAAPTVTRPSTPSNYARTDSPAGLPPTNNFYGKGKKKEDLSDIEGPDTRLQSGLESFPSARNNGTTVFRPSSKTAALTHGLGAVPKQPKALFNPEATGALVMKRLDEEIEKRLNKKGLPVVDVVVDPILAGRMRAHQKE